jgi:hypothetical protein
LTRTRKLLLANGYRLAEGASNERGHLTYTHDANADNTFLLALSHAGWQADDDVPPVYRLPSAGLMIEIEPSGADTSSHYLQLIDNRGERDRPGPVRVAFDSVREAVSSAFGFLRQDDEKPRVRLRAPWSSKMKLVLGVIVALLLFGSGVWASLSVSSLSQNTGAWVAHTR